MIKFILLLTLSTTISFYLFGQKKFEVTLSFPEALDISKLNIELDNGFGRLSTDFKSTKHNEVALSGVYYSRYMAIVLNYPQTEHMVFKNFFFVNEKPAKIKFIPSGKDSSPFDIM
jgi:hypothetical protein